MRRLLIILVSIAVVYILHYSLMLRAFPNTYISYMNVSGMTESRMKKELLKQFSKPVKMRIRDRVYARTWKDLGVVIDEDTIVRTVFEPNHAPFPNNLILYAKSFISPRVTLPALIFPDEYYRIAQRTVYDFTTRSDEVSVDPKNNVLAVAEHSEKYTIDTERMKDLIAFKFGNEDPLQPELARVTSPEKQMADDYNKTLENVYSSPVTIVAEDNGKVMRFTVPADEIRKTVTVNYDPATNHFSLNLNDDAFRKLMASTSVHFESSKDRRLAYDDMKDAFISLIRNRAQGKNSNTIMARADYVPNSSGKESSKYIEVDISQQKMYLFENGEMKKKYRVSTGLYYPTPTGIFKVMNKATNAFSNIYNVWMPYWMAFGYSSELNAYFGIHETPYWIDSDSNKIQRPSQFIGSPNTGGCVALGLGDAKEVYDFADVGTPIYIYD